jgi:hypothetical protein
MHVYIYIYICMSFAHTHTNNRLTKLCTHTHTNNRLTKLCTHTHTQTTDSQSFAHTHTNNRLTKLCAHTHKQQTHKALHTHTQATDSQKHALHAMMATDKSSCTIPAGACTSASHVLGVMQVLCMRVWRHRARQPQRVGAQVLLGAGQSRGRGSHQQRLLRSGIRVVQGGLFQPVIMVS